MAIYSSVDSLFVSCGAGGGINQVSDSRSVGEAERGHSDRSESTDASPEPVWARVQPRSEAGSFSH